MPRKYLVLIICFSYQWGDCTFFQQANQIYRQNKDYWSFDSKLQGPINYGLIHPVQIIIGDFSQDSGLDLFRNYLALN